jgi:phosphoglycolate phosphatase-like HAD superfamily hydrolase
MVSKATVFDLDGTLFCLPINWENLFEEIKHIMNVDVVRPIVEVISKVDDETRREVFNAWENAELSVYEKATPCEEGMEQYKKAVNKPKALVTMQGKRIVENLMCRFNLSFDVIVTRDDSLNRAEQLEVASQKLKTPLTEILFIGNADSDAIAAEKVGCKFIRVKTPTFT